LMYEQHRAKETKYSAISPSNIKTVEVNFH
jgi:hypothetical protein